MEDRVNVGFDWPRRRDLRAAESFTLRAPPEFWYKFGVSEVPEPTPLAKSPFPQND
jgi:hypothetical protein